MINMMLPKSQNWEADLGNEYKEDWQEAVHPVYSTYNYNRLAEIQNKIVHWLHIAPVTLRGISVSPFAESEKQTLDSFPLFLDVHTDC